MAEYKSIKGFKTQSFATDPVASQAAGGSWASGGNLNDARSELVGAGIQTAAMAYSGYTPAGASTTQSESYDGSAWTSTPTLNTPRYAGGGTGVQTAALMFGGETTPGGPGTHTATEEWDGSAWTVGGAMNTGLRYRAGSGTVPAALAMGGNPPTTTAVEQYNGSAWTELSANLNTARTSAGSLNGTGPASATLFVGGNTPPSTNLVEVYDGTSWAETGDLNTSRNQINQGAGTTTEALVFGGVNVPGSPPPSRTAATEAFDGTAWAIGGDLAVARYGGMGGGSQAAAVTAGGSIGTPTYQEVTEEWTTGPASFVKVQEGQVWYNSTDSDLKFYNGTATKTVTVS